MNRHWLMFRYGIGYRIFNALFPIYTPTSWANDPNRNFLGGNLVAYVRLPFFIVFPLRWWRDLQIRFLTWKLRNRDRVSG